MLLDNEINSLKETLLKEEMKKLISDFKCNICGTFYTSNLTWKRHMSSHNTIFSCETCKKTFNDKGNLRRHSKLHQRPPKPRTRKKILYSCSLCQTGLENKNELYSHMKSVHETRTESCPTCEKSFFSKSELTQHRKIHTDYPRHLSCDHCNYKTDSNYVLKVHMETHSEIKYPCDVCKMECNTQQSLRQHVNLAHGEKNKETYNCRASTKVLI